MRDVIQRILQAESEAKHLLEQARQEAERIETQARNEAQEIEADVQRELQTEAGRILEETARRAEQEKHELLDRATRDIEEQVQLPEILKKKAVQEVIRCVCGWREPTAEGRGVSAGGLASQTPRSPRLNRGAS